MLRPYDLGCHRALDSIGMEKRALWPELWSRAHRDVGNTRQTMPWLGFMRKHSPSDLQAIEDKWHARGQKYVTRPMTKLLSPLSRQVEKLPEGKVKDWSEKTIGAVSEDPLLGALPGGAVALPAKKILEKVIREKFPHE